MSKKSRKRKTKRKAGPSTAGPLLRSESDGLHALVPGVPPSPEMLDEMTRLYQQNIRNSPLWEEMVKQFGEEEAERILREFQVKLG